MRFNTSSLKDIRQTAEYALFMEALNWQTIKVGTNQAFVKKLPILPCSIIKILRFKPPLNGLKINQLRKVHRVIIFKKEPMIIKKLSGSQIYFKVDSKNCWPLTPTKTLWVNLNQSQKTLLDKMKPKTRYNLKKSQREGLKIKVLPGNKVSQRQLKKFYSLWVNNKPHNWIFKPPFHELNSLIKAFGDRCFLILIFKGRLLVAASLQLTSKNMAFYWHNGSTNLGKKLFAPTLCVWTAIKESQKRHLRVFDFEGVWDERFPQLNKGWKGFTRFKQGFVGKA